MPTCGLITDMVGLHDSFCQISNVAMAAVHISANSTMDGARVYMLDPSSQGPLFAPHLCVLT